MLSNVWSKVEPAAASFFSQLGRRIYVSPKSYLDFLRTFLNMLGERRRALSTRLARQVVLATILCGRRVARTGQHQIVAYLEVDIAATVLWAPTTRYRYTKQPLRFIKYFATHLIFRREKQPAGWGRKTGRDGSHRKGTQARIDRATTAPGG